MVRFLRIAVVLVMAWSNFSIADETIPPQIEDLYLADVAVDPITLDDGQSAIYIRQRVDQTTREWKRSLWRVDANGGPRAMEPGEPNASHPMLSPDGKWIVFLSTRPFPDGTPAFKPVPPYSDPAADIWLIPIQGGKAIPLGGPQKPYGRALRIPFIPASVFRRTANNCCSSPMKGRIPAPNRNAETT